MQVSLVLNPRTTRCLQANLGAENVTAVEREDGYMSVEFEIRNYMDVLYVLHAGQDSGLELGLYGTEGKPLQKVA